MTLLTFQEFKQIVNYKGNVDIAAFNIDLKTKLETYLYGLIGAAMVEKINTDTLSSEINDATKNCLAWEMFRHYVSIGNIFVNEHGANERTSQYTKSVEYVDKQNKLREISYVLKQYESRLIDLIKDYSEYNGNTTTTSYTHLIISQI